MSVEYLPELERCCLVEVRFVSTDEKLSHVPLPDVWVDLVGNASK